MAICSEQVSYNCFLDIEKARRRSARSKRACLYGIPQINPWTRPMSYPDHRLFIVLGITSIDQILFVDEAAPHALPGELFQGS
mmetsp:Transcript_18023/g.72135  ORF Transcript_18023/g.72135 Transcript_18023/m.72135 type:complete len:83 (+) Transcript_18023:2031-2279(+)